MLNDLMGGQISAGLDTHIGLIGLHKSGKIRILASFGEKRSALLPDVPTIAELGFKDAAGSGWYSMWAPAKTPPTAVAALEQGAEHRAGERGRAGKTSAQRRRGRPPHAGGTREIPPRGNREVAAGDRGVRIQGGLIQACPGPPTRLRSGQVNPRPRQGTGSGWRSSVAGIEAVTCCYVRFVPAVQLSNQMHPASKPP
ncbi:MAG: hypothetical protein IPM02_21545 [Betaproteobacteria bacterium]|nr:hypothetical protein [Betaproteobacteria bacterium]